jgi:hypothetical protein
LSKDVFEYTAIAEALRQAISPEILDELVVQTLKESYDISSSFTDDDSVNYAKALRRVIKYYSTTDEYNEWKKQIKSRAVIQADTW